MSLPSVYYDYEAGEVRFPISPVRPADFFSDVDLALISFLEAAERFGASLDPTRRAGAVRSLSRRRR